MQEKTVATQQKSASLESNEKMTSMAPPAFGLTASSVDGGGDDKKGGVQHRVEGKGSEPYTMKVSPESNPFKMIPLTWPGQIAWVHSPCFSQELEAEALNAAQNGEFQPAVSNINSTILKLSQMPFRNSEGTENDWAKRMMKDSVLMNPDNKAATLIGSGFPKLVVLTFWNDPSKPGQGGMNYSYFIELSYDILPKGKRKDEGGGMILMGDGDSRKLDLSHFSEKVVEINEYMSMALEIMKACYNGARPDPKSLPSNMPAAIKHLIEQAKNGFEGVDKAQNTKKEYDRQQSDKEAKNRYEHENFVTINGEKYEKDKEYIIEFTLDGKPHSSVHSAAWFMKNYGTEFEQGKCLKLKFNDL